MAVKQLVTKVWIAPGCIVCDACETTCPDVFDVRHDDGTCLIRPDALDAEFTKPRSQLIKDAAAECPVDVIKFDTIEVEVSDAEAAAAPAPAAPAAAKAPAAGEHKAPAPTKAHAEKPAKTHEVAGPKIVDPAIQALLEAATTRGGKAMIDKPAFNAAAALKRIQQLPPDKLPPDARQQLMLEKTRPSKPEDVTRRNLVLAAAWGAMAAVGGISGVAFGRFMMPNALEEPDPRVRIGGLDKYREMNPGDVNEDYKNSGKFWIIREEKESRIAALSIICTHLGCVPSWLPNDRKFKCPCHGSGFKANGVNFEGPAPRPLERFKIFMDGDTVIVDRSKKFLAMGPNDTGVWNDPESYIEV